MHFNNSTETIRNLEENNLIYNRVLTSRKIPWRGVLLAIVVCITFVGISGVVWHFVSQENAENASKQGIIFQYATSSPTQSEISSRARTKATTTKTNLYKTCEIRDLLDVKEYVNAVKMKLDLQYEDLQKYVESIKSELRLVSQEASGAPLKALQKFKELLPSLCKNASGYNDEKHQMHLVEGTKQKNISETGQKRTRPEKQANPFKIHHRDDGVEFYEGIDQVEHHEPIDTFLNSSTLVQFVSQQVKSIVLEEINKLHIQQTQNLDTSISCYVKNVTNKLNARISNLNATLENSSREAILNLAKTVKNLSGNLKDNISSIFRKLRPLEEQAKTTSLLNKTLPNQNESISDLCAFKSDNSVDLSVPKLNAVIHGQCLLKNQTTQIREMIKLLEIPVIELKKNFTKKLIVQRVQIVTLMRGLVSQERRARSDIGSNLQKSVIALQKSSQRQVALLNQQQSATNEMLQAMSEKEQSLENTTKQLQNKLTGKIDKGWIQAPNGYAYMVKGTKSNWYTAIAYCISKQAHLAYHGLRDPNVHRFLYNAVIRPLDKNVWIGLENDISTDRWKWLDGQQLTRIENNWARGQPSMYGRNQACVIVTPFLGKWNDLPCGSNTMYALCEKLSQS